MEVSVAPEPKDIIWPNVQVDSDIGASRSFTANVLLGLGVILWSIPLTLIQVRLSLVQAVGGNLEVYLTFSLLIQTGGLGEGRKRQQNPNVRVAGKLAWGGLHVDYKQLLTRHCSARPHSSVTTDF